MLRVVLKEEPLEGTEKEQGGCNGRKSMESGYKPGGVATHLG